MSAEPKARKGQTKSPPIKKKEIKKMIPFIAVILVWCFMGFLGILNCKADRPNYEMIVFMFSFPFIPFVAHLCGLI